MNLSDILIILALVCAVVFAIGRVRKKKGCSCGSCKSCDKCGRCGK